MRITRKQLASCEVLPGEALHACQRALANSPDNWGNLSCNPVLDARVWHILWGEKRLQADQAKRLVGRVLDRAQRDRVLASEKRSGVLGHLIEHNRLDRDEQERLSQQANVCAVLLRQDWFDADLRPRAAVRAGGISYLFELATSAEDAYTDAERRQAVLSYREWICDKEYARRARYLRILFGRWPELGDLVLAAANPPEEMLTAIAGSAHLTDGQARKLIAFEDGVSRLSDSERHERKYCLLALAANPRCPADIVTELVGWGGDVGQGAKRREGRSSVTGSYRDIDDPRTLEWVVSRSLCKSGQYGVQQDRPIELLELAQNPHLEAEQRAAVKDCIDANVEPRLLRLYGWSETSSTPDTGASEYHDGWETRRTHDPFAYAAEKLGGDQGRWELFVGLIDDFDGTFEELVDLACSL